MITKPMNPCKDCSRQGCGAYHDICKTYQDWKIRDQTYKQLLKEERQRWKR